MHGRRSILAVAILAASLHADDQFEMTKEEKAVVELTNKEREKENLPALKPHPLLFKAAREHSKNMAKQDKLEHVLDGVKPHERVQKTGYKGGFVGENIAGGRAPFPPREAMKLWMESEGHKANILKKEYECIGIGIARSASGEMYYTQVFAKAPRN